MARLSIDLPSDVANRLEAKAHDSGHDSVESYVEALLLLHSSEPEEDPGAPPRVTYESDDAVAAMLLKRMDNPAPGIEATPEFWAAFKRGIGTRPDQQR